jgi:isoleucyl-tRNA synthetase
MDYSDTLNLPKTEFPMKADLARREPEFQRFWEEIDLYRKSLERPAPKGTFILHDGPPYSNGDLHLGHALNKILKDIIVKYRTMDGYRSPYVPGWDNHGMPIENNVAQEFQKRKEQPTRTQMRERCREYARSFVEKQREQFRRLGVRGDWENPYLTMSPEFEATIVKVFGELATQGFIYRGLKPIHWCANDRTALAEAEIEYAEKTSASIYVRFPLLEDPNQIFPQGGENATIIWTTTPWTIPANLAVAVHPDFDYAIVEAKGARYLVAYDLVASVMTAIGISDYRVVSTHRGESLMGLKFRHPLFSGARHPVPGAQPGPGTGPGVDRSTRAPGTNPFDRASPVVTADYVTLDAGTGVVHTAPGHGREDFLTGQKFGLEILSPVDEAGRFTQEAGPFAGMDVQRGDKAVIEALKEAGALLAQGSVAHSYPHCWRCHGPLIFRATVQWFMNIDHNGHRQRCIEEIEKVRWYPAESVNRITSMVANRPDWCLSRQRSWGVGIPVFYCAGCRHELMTEESLAAAHRLVREHGSDAWFERPASEILPAGTTCGQCGGTEFTKETDILDVWFDSGSTCRAVLETRPELRYPSDVYLEGSDQHRGWFNSSLMVGVGTKRAAPYRAVVTCGWTLDAEGRAMHKSWGNAISPQDIVSRHGADVLRLWVASTNYFEDVRLSEEILKRVTDAYRRVRNTFRFLLGNLSDFDPARDAVSLGEMPEIDRWALHRLGELIDRAHAGYESYEFHRVYRAVVDFCGVDLSAFYLDVLKDRLYTSPPASRGRRAAQTVLWTLADALARLMAPVLSHTCEEVWRFLPGVERVESVQLADFPVADPEWRDPELAARWEELRQVRELVNGALEEAKTAGTIEKPLAAQVTLTVPPGQYERLSSYRDDLAGLFIVSRAVLVAGAAGSGPTVQVAAAEGARCDRCWLVLPTVGRSAEHPTLCHRCVEAVRHQPSAVSHP